MNIDELSINSLFQYVVILLYFEIIHLFFQTYAHVHVHMRRNYIHLGLRNKSFSCLSLASCYSRVSGRYWCGRVDKSLFNLFLFFRVYFVY